MRSAGSPKRCLWHRSHDPPLIWFVIVTARPSSAETNWQKAAAEAGNFKAQWLPAAIGSSAIKSHFAIKGYKQTKWSIISICRSRPTFGTRAVCGTGNCLS
jgi:hypothetical protein